MKSSSPLRVRTASHGPILVFSEGISYCHIVRPLLIARWLKELGQPILVACTEKSAPLFSAEGFSTLPLHTACPYAIYSRLRRGAAMFESSELRAYFERDRFLIERTRPQLIVADFRFSALQWARAWNIPSVGITSASCHPHFVAGGSVPDPYLPPPFLPARVFDFIAQTPLGAGLRRRIVDGISAPLREASRAQGLEPLPTFFEYASQGDLCLLCDHPEVMPVREMRPGDLYAGALIWERADALPSGLRLDPHKRSVYICLGTQESLPIHFLEPYVRALLACGLQVVVSRGQRRFDLTLSHPAFQIFDFLNESKLLSAVDLFVHPGGAQSTYQGLSSGVPMIALPAQADQHFHAEALVRQGVGVFFRPSRLRVDELVSASLALAADAGARERSRNMQRRLSEYSAKARVLARVRELCARECN